MECCHEEQDNCVEILVERLPDALLAVPGLNHLAIPLLLYLTFNFTGRWVAVLRLQ